MDASVISDVKHHCAAPTWNGFVYQGKIALIVVLDLLLSQDQNWKHYALELEWREDFSIIGNERHVSIHQVKCKAATGPGDYQDAINKLRENIYSGENNGERSTAPAKYLHTASFVSSLQEEDISLYDYGEEQCFMPIDVLDAALQNRIRRYLDKVDSENSGSRSVAFYERCLLYVCNIVTAKIQEIHRINHTGTRVADIDKLIPFREIIALLRKDFNANSSDYYTFRIKQIFNKAFENFFLENEITEGAMYMKLCDYSSMINSLSDQNFRKFCLSIFPGADVEKESGFPELHAHIITDNFCEVLSQVSLLASMADKDFKLLYHKEDTNYLPSSVGDKKKRVIHEFRRNIYEDAYLEVLYEVQAIVTKSVSFSSLQEELGHIMDVQDHDSHPGKREKINQVQAIEIIDLEAAKQRIDTND